MLGRDMLAQVLIHDRDMLLHVRLPGMPKLGAAPVRSCVSTMKLCEDQSVCIALVPDNGLVSLASPEFTLLVEGFSFAEFRENGCVYSTAIGIAFSRVEIDERRSVAVIF